MCITTLLFEEKKVVWVPHFETKLLASVWMLAWPHLNNLTLFRSPLNKAKLFKWGHASIQTEANNLVSKWGTQTTKGLRKRP